jgi:hypothetical protein
VSHNFVMDWVSIWKDIAAGLLLGDGNLAPAGPNFAEVFC